MCVFVCLLSLQDNSADMSVLDTLTLTWIRHKQHFEVSTTPIRCKTALHCNTLQHTATCCNTLQHALTRFNTLQCATICCNTLQHAATRCNTPHYTATHFTNYSTRFTNDSTIPNYRLFLCLVLQTLPYTTHEY